MKDCFGQVVFFVVLVGLLSFGQLERVTLTNQISFYYHDLLIVSWLLFTFWREKKLIGATFKSWFKAFRAARFWWLSLVLVAILIIGWLLAFSAGSLTLAAPAYLLRFLTYIVFFVIIYVIKPLPTSYWSRLFFLLNFLWLFWGLLQYYLLPDTRFLFLLGWDEHYYRLIGTWFDPAFLGLALVWFSFWLLFKLTRQKPFFARAKLPLWFLTGLTFWAILLTYSRSVYLAFGLGLVALIFFCGWQSKGEPRQKDQNKGKLVTLILSSVAILLVSLVIVFFLLPQPEFGGDSTNLFRYNSTQIRIKEAQKYLTNFTPLTLVFGRGLFVAQPYDPVWLDPQASGVKLTANFADNFLLTFLSFFGLAGGAVIFYALGKIIAFLSHQKLTIFYPFLISWVIVAFFANAFFQPFLLLSFGFLWLALTSIPNKKTF